MFQLNPVIFHKGYNIYTHNIVAIISIIPWWFILGISLYYLWWHDNIIGSHASAVCAFFITATSSE